MADDDRRDERIGAWLEPEPLDEVTRRRLVSTAMQRGRDRRLRPEREAGRDDRRSSVTLRWIATAAAIVALLVGALALFTARGGNDEPQAAAPVHTPDSGGGSARSSGGSNAEAAEPEAAKTAPVDVGDFGDLSRADEPRPPPHRARTGAGPRGRRAPTPERQRRRFAGHGLGGSTFSTLACRDRLPAGTVDRGGPRHARRSARDRGAHRAPRRQPLHRRRAHRSL